MSDLEVRSFSREFKLRAVQRMEAGENVSALARELTVKRVILYRWRDAYRLGGVEALRLRGRPSKTEALAMAAARGVAGRANDLAEARWQIEQLQRKVGQQQLDLDFFKQALRRIEASRRPSDGPGETASSPTSKR
ncbi:MAG TPA: transposase [Caulobacteraceae bacterium]